MQFFPAHGKPGQNQFFKIHCRDPIAPALPVIREFFRIRHIPSLSIIKQVPQIIQAQVPIVRRGPIHKEHICPAVADGQDACPRHLPQHWVWLSQADAGIVGKVLVILPKDLIEEIPRFGDRPVSNRVGLPDKDGALPFHRRVAGQCSQAELPVLLPEIAAGKHSRFRDLKQGKSAVFARLYLIQKLQQSFRLRQILRDIPAAAQNAESCPRGNSLHPRPVLGNQRGPLPFFCRRIIAAGGQPPADFGEKSAALLPGGLFRSGKFDLPAAGKQEYYQQERHAPKETGFHFSLSSAQRRMAASIFSAAALFSALTEA